MKLQQWRVEIAHFVSPQTFILLAQNGYGNFEAAAESIAAERLILGRVIFGAETTDLGASRVTVIADDVVIGSPANLIAPQVLETFSRAFNAAGIPTRISSEVMKIMGQNNLQLGLESARRYPGSAVWEVG